MYALTEELDTKTKKVDELTKRVSALEVSDVAAAFGSNSTSNCFSYPRRARRRRSPETKIHCACRNSSLSDW